MSLLVRWAVAVDRGTETSPTEITFGKCKCEGKVYRCGSAAQEVQIGIFSKQVRFRLWGVESLAAHYEVAAEVVTCEIKVELKEDM